MLVTRLLLTVRGERQSCPCLFLSLSERWHRRPQRRRRVSTSNAISVLDTRNASVMNKRTLIASDAETLPPRLLRSEYSSLKGGE